MSSDPVAVPQDPPRPCDLKGTGLMDTPPDEAFDRLTRLAAALLRVPVAVLSLLDGGRLVFKSGVGLPDGRLAPRVQPPGPSLCGRAAAGPEPVLLRDIADQPALAEASLARELGMAAFAGVPFGTEGCVPFGALCVMDARPRSWEETELRTLAELAAVAAREVEWRCREAGMRKTERDLRLQRVHLDELFETSPEAIVLLDVEERVVRGNSEFMRTFGYRAEEIVGRPINELIVPPDRLDEAERVTRSVTSGRPVSLETVRRRSDGTRIDVSILGKPVNLDDSPVAIYLVYRDVTEHRRAERELKESEERYRQMFEGNRAIKLLVDAETGRVVDANAAAAAFYGYPAETLRAMRVTDLNLLPEDEVREAIDHTLRGGQSARVFPHRLASGEVRHVEVHSAPVEVRGRTLLYSILTDVTSRRQAEEERAAAVAARDRFYATVSHELRTPISAVMLYNDLLLSGGYGALTESQVEGVQRSQAAAAGLLELVNEVLDLARLESGKMEAHPVEFGAAAFLADVLAAVRPLADEHGCDLGLDLEGAPARLATDPLLVRQVLLNLLGNAVKYGASSPVCLACRGGGAGDVLLEVTDRGPGIPPEDRERVFEEFVRLGEGTQPGTGLGLTIARRLAELLGGRLEVESVVGEGSTFRLVLPAVAASGADSTA